MALPTTPLDQIFAPQYLRRYQDVLLNQKRLVHYTSAEAAMLIISGKSIWLRNTMFMNDVSEVHHAQNLIATYFGVKNVARVPFWNAIDRVTGGRANAIRQLYDGWSFDLSTATYVCCVSEHRDEEDRVGRLSMWRAYGKPHGVALIVNPLYLASTSDALGSYSYPVEYCDQPRADLLFAEVERNMLAKEPYLATLNPDDVFNYVFHCFLIFTLTLKHPGFEEEKEWRVIHRPNYQKSALLTEKVVAIGGAPQKVFALPLQNNPQLGIDHISPLDLIDHVVIGPSTHAFAMWRGFVEALQEAGVTDADRRVHCSHIPVRTQ